MNSQEHLLKKYGRLYRKNKVRIRINLIIRNLDTNKTGLINPDIKSLFGDPELFGASSIVPGKYRIKKKVYPGDFVAHGRQLLR